MPEKYDAIVIGTGQAGPSLALKLAGSGQKVAVIERKLFGGTCVNTGCIPTKTMVASAKVARMAREAKRYGVDIGGPVSVDLKRVQARKDEVLLQSRNGLEKSLTEAENCTVYRGQARFVSDHSVQVNGTELTSDRIFINVGGRANIPSLTGLDKVPYLTNSSMMHLETLPSRLLVLGGSYIGLEFAQMFRRFGSEVTVIERSSRLLSHEDQDVSEGIVDILANEQIDVQVNAHCVGVNAAGDEVEAHIEGGPVIKGSHLLLALGRRSNTDDLGLENTGIQTDKKGDIVVNDELQTTVEGVWALGDCNGKGAFTHTSYNDFEIVAGNLLNGEHRRVSDRITTYALYIDPPLGRAGMTEEQVRSSGRKALIGKRPMTKVGRAVEKGETQGFMKVLVDAATNQILGAAILGVEGDEVIHCILDTMYAKAPYTVLQRAVHIHPTVSELVPTMLGELKPFN